ncbi:hypothetical protein [Chelativorans sp. J32]|uniref:hypothetical protein n=1 Tax=Chelativorans sp. J32 TaxID=935840 RepID=UPI0012EB0B5A|nr:hypothetical protein [Chelativorans sp. J32]
MRKTLLATSALLLVAAFPAAAQDTSTMRVWRLVPQGQAYAPGDCVEVSGGTEQFHPSGQDTPSQQGAPGQCPPGMAPADQLTTGSTSDEGEEDSVTGDQDDSSGQADGAGSGGADTGGSAGDAGGGGAGGSDTGGAASD